MAEHRRSKQALQRVQAQERGEDVTERRQMGELQSIRSRHAVGDEPVEHRRGHLVVEAEHQQGEKQPH